MSYTDETIILLIDSRLKELHADVNRLKATNNAQAVKISALEGKVTHLEQGVAATLIVEQDKPFFQHLVTNRVFYQSLSSTLESTVTKLKEKVSNLKKNPFHYLSGPAVAWALLGPNPQVQELTQTLDNFRRDATAVYVTKTDLDLAKVTSPSSKPKVLAPSLFSGKREDWKSFRSHLDLFFAASGSSYPKDTDKIMFAMSRLGETSAFKYMQKYVSDFSKPALERPVLISDYSIFVKTMGETFGILNAGVIAEAQIRKLKQTGSTQDYTVKFVELAEETGWNDAAKISQYRLNLKSAVVDELGRRDDEPTTFAEFTQLAEKIDNRQYAHAQHTRGQGRGYSPTAPPFHSTTSSSPIAARTSAPASTPSPSSTAMDLSQVRHTGPISDEERKRRKDNNLCMYCGNDKHYQRDCPKCPSNLKTTTSLATSSVVQSSDPSSTISFTLGKDDA